MARTKQDAAVDALRQARTAVDANQGALTKSAAHGPPKPAKHLYGIAHLRRTLNLSTDVPIDELCEDAALRISQLELRIPRKDR